MTDKKKRKDRNKEVRDNLFVRIGNNLKRMFSSLWRMTKSVVRTVGQGLTATAVLALSIPAFMLLLPAALIILTGVIILEMFHPDGTAHQQHQQPVGDTA